jgi:hypothetical protein
MTGLINGAARLILLKEPKWNFCVDLRNNISKAVLKDGFGDVAQNCSFAMIRDSGAKENPHIVCGE